MWPTWRIKALSYTPAKLIIQLGDQINLITDRRQALRFVSALPSLVRDRLCVSWGCVYVAVCI